MDHCSHWDAESIQQIDLCFSNVKKHEPSEKVKTIHIRKKKTNQRVIGVIPASWTNLNPECSM